MASPGAPPLGYRGAGEGPHLNSSVALKLCFPSVFDVLPFISFSVQFRVAQRISTSNYR